MRALVVLLGAEVLAGQQRNGLELRNLPAAVQKSVADNLKGGTIRHIGKEKEDGIEQYEIETLRNGKSRDFNVDPRGKLLVVEEASSMDVIPAAARAAILRKVAGGTLAAVETATVPGRAATYEASYRDKSGRRREVQVRADGVEIKD